MAKVVKSTDKKQDFISFIASMSDTEINEYIKSHGKPPKKIEMIDVLEIPERSLEEWINSLSR